MRALAGTVVFFLFSLDEHLSHFSFMIHLKNFKKYFPIQNFDFPGGSEGKATVYNVRDLGLIPGLGRFPGEGNGNPLQYSCLENPMDGGAWCRLLSMGWQRVGHNWATSLSLYKIWEMENRLKMYTARTEHLNLYLLLMGKIEFQ